MKAWSLGLTDRGGHDEGLGAGGRARRASCSTWPQRKEKGATVLAGSVRQRRRGRERRRYFGVDQTGGGAPGCDQLGTKEVARSPLLCERSRGATKMVAASRARSWLPCAVPSGVPDIAALPAVQQHGKEAEKERRSVGWASDRGRRAVNTDAEVRLHDSRRGATVEREMRCGEDEVGRGRVSCSASRSGRGEERRDHGEKRATVVRLSRG